MNTSLHFSCFISPHALKSTHSIFSCDGINKIKSQKDNFMFVFFLLLLFLVVFVFLINLLNSLHEPTSISRFSILTSFPLATKSSSHVMTFSSTLVIAVLWSKGGVNTTVFSINSMFTVRIGTLVCWCWTKKNKTIQNITLGTTEKAPVRKRLKFEYCFVLLLTQTYRIWCFYYISCLLKSVNLLCKLTCPSIKHSALNMYNLWLRPKSYKNILE